MHLVAGGYARFADVGDGRERGMNPLQEAGT